MTDFEAQAGTWIIENLILKGSLGPNNTRAYIAAGSETETNYDFSATVTLDAGSTKASIIVFRTVNEDWTENFVECILNKGAQLLQIDLVYGASRVTVASRVFTLVANQAYNVNVKARVRSSDGSGYVKFSVSGVVQLAIEDLAATFTKGMYGFALEGTAPTNTVQFSLMAEAAVGYVVLVDLKDLLHVTDETHNSELMKSILDADGYIDTILMLFETVLPLTVVPGGIRTIAKFFAGALYLRRFPTSDASYRQADAYWNQAQDMLDEYVRRKYYVGRAYSS